MASERKDTTSEAWRSGATGATITTKRKGLLTFTSTEWFRTKIRIDPVIAIIEEGPRPSERDGVRSAPQRGTQAARASRTAGPRSDLGTQRRSYASARPVGSPRGRAKLTEKQRRAQEERVRSRARRAQQRARGPLGYRMPTRRLRFVSFLVTVLLCAFALRLGQVQLVYGDELREKAQAMRTKTMPLKAERGQITDRHGVAIAKSVTRYKVFADQELIEKWSQLTPDGEKKVARVTLLNFLRHCLI